MKPSKELKNVLKSAYSIARENDAALTIGGILLSLLENDNDVQSIFSEHSKIDTFEVYDILDECYESLASSPQMVHDVLTLAACQSTFLEEREVSTMSVMYALTHFDDELANIFEKTGLQPSLFINVDKRKAEGIANYYPGSKNGKSEAPTESAIPRDVGKYVTKMNCEEYLADHTTLVGRENELNDIVMSLCRRNKNNVLLVGHRGVGKSSLGVGLASRIKAGDVPEKFKSYDMYKIDIHELVAGSCMRGMLEERFASINKAFSGLNAILFIDDIHTAIGNGRSGQQSEISASIKQLLDNNSITVLATTTWDSYRKSIEDDSNIGNRFNRVVIEEPSAIETVAIVTGIKRSFEEHYDISIENSVIDSVIDYTTRFMKDRKLPGKAFEVIDMAGSRAMLEGRDVITDHDVAKEVSVLANISVETIITPRYDIPSSLRENLKKVIIGQDAAIDVVVDRLAISICGLNDDNKPMGSFIFRGTTGCGKTELAKQISKSMDIPLFRIDMSEYQEPYSVTKLIGTPVGYTGYEQNAGILVTSIIENPNCVILLDEVEKGHPDVMTILLQLMDNAKITSSAGADVDCQGVILIMTTNLDAEQSSKSKIGFGESAKPTQSDAEFNKFFAPEFRNRLDAIVTFEPISNDAASKIAIKFIEELKSKLQTKGFTMDYDDALVEYITEVGFDEKMGARPMKRAINKYLKLPISSRILAPEVSDGIKVSVECGEVVIW